ncbi:phage tail assembly protein [Methylobacterium durans]|uniref:Phage tail assembly protein n=1 Tax=Methylobacterium durans TaxID=2202825 RepID=A0A2U8WC22_9HYPH|nr:phage tail assembly protein [Methylobacterium durans]AWN43168.1 hypothetical protein DK389_25070 [Methylobacterium durans]
MADETPKPAGTVTVSLSQAIPANGQEVSELTFRKPTAMDIIEVGGNPVRIDMNHSDPASTIDFDGRRMSAMMSRLAAVPPSAIARMDTNDWAACAWKLSDFFLPVQRTA